MKFGNSRHIWCGVLEGTQNQIPLFTNVIVHLISTISLLSTLVANVLSQIFFSLFVTHTAIKFSVSLVRKFEIRTYSFCFKSYSQNR